MKYTIMLVGMLFAGAHVRLHSQKILQGIVSNEKEEWLTGASIFWKSNKQAGTVSDSLGRFSLPHTQHAADTLVVSYVGYLPVEVLVLGHETRIWIELKHAVPLPSAEVSDRKFDNAASLLQPLNVERIGKRELRKAPCCNLSESFETVGAVDVVYSNALTGIKEIQMLGLRGIYSQFLMESRPTMGGIATPFAFEFIPGTWLDEVALVKGASSVRTGFNGITGQINVDLVKPHLDKPLFINAFTSTEGRAELNVHLNKKNKRTAHGLLLHGNFVENKWDRNHDHFYDSPNRRQINGLYRWTLESPLGCAQFNVQALSDRRISGQMDIPHDHQGSPPSVLFRINMHNDRVEMWGKFGKEGIGGKPYQQVGNIMGVSWHRAQASFGNNRYHAMQQSAYWQSLYESILGTTAHRIVVASSIQFDDIQESINDIVLNRRDFQPGIMMEYTYSRPNISLGMPDMTFVAGARVDWQNRLGWFFTPRASYKYQFNANTVARASAGRGFRVPHLMAENLSQLASNRIMIFAADLGAEEAWNYGLNLTHDFKLAAKSGQLIVDVFRTDFIRQILVDVEKDYRAVYFYNLTGKSVAHSALAVLQYNFFQGFDAKVAWKLNDVRATFDDGHLKSVPLVARHRGVITLEYNTPSKQWMFNTITHVVGPQRLPDNSAVPKELLGNLPEISPTYWLQNVQITRRWHHTEVYLGGENIFNFHQKTAVIAANDPSSPFFNGAQLWAPTMGQLIYLGVRFSPYGVAVE